MKTARTHLPCIEPLEARIAPAVIFAVTETNRLISFDSAAPGTLLSAMAITGLVTPATERMEAIDFRAATGELIGLGIQSEPTRDNGTLYRIDPATGAATAVRGPGLLLEVAAHYGFEIDPVADWARIVSDTDHLSLDPDGGDFAFGAVPDRAGAEEEIFATAHDRSFAGTAATTLYGLDFTSNSLVRIGGADGVPSPDGGVVTIVGPLGLTANSQAGGFDIETRTGKGFASIFTNAGGTDLYMINLTTGAATVVGNIGDGTTKVRGLTAALPSNLAIAANGKSATFTDIDGDKVTVTTSAGALSAGQFTFGVASALGRQLLQFKVSSNNFADASLAFTATPVAGRGDGFVAIGRIDATGFDLGKVTVDGDLGQIDAGDGQDGDTALAVLTVHSLGALGTSTQFPGGDLKSEVKGKLGALTIKTDLLGAQLVVAVGGSLGRVFIGGDLVGGNGSLGAGLFINGPMGDLTIGGSIIGGSTALDGAIQAASLGKVSLGGSLIGGTGGLTGAIQAFSTTIGAVTIKGDLVGGSDALSGFLSAAGDIASATVGGSLLGGTVADPVIDSRSGSIRAGGSIPGGVKIGGDVRGGNGTDGGAISAQTNLGPVTIGGALVGGGGLNSGSIRTGAGDLGAVKIGGDVRSGAGIKSGHIMSGASIASVAIGGSLVQVDSSKVADIAAATTLGPVTIGGEVRGLSLGGVGLIASGVADTAGGIKSIAVKGSVTNAVFVAGALTSSNADAAIGPVKVGGDWIASSIVAGATVGGDDVFGTADDVKIAEAAPDALFSTIASVTIGGYVMGTVGGTDQFGFVAEKIGAMTVGGVKVPLTAGLDKAGFALGATGDVRVREVDATAATFPAPTPPASANPLIYAVDQNNNLITFRADAPGAILTTVNITGLGAGERIDGLDFRPATGGLYALGLTTVADADNARLLRLDPATGAATVVGAIDAFAGGQRYGFDFDPVTDRIRLVTDLDGNARVDPDTGTVADDTPLSDATSEENVFGLAYDRSFIGGRATTAYALDYANNVLLRIGDPDGAPASANGGVLTRIGTGLGFNIDESAAANLGEFDIESRTGVGYATFVDLFNPGGSKTGLYKINLQTGAATALGDVNSAAKITSMAVAPPSDIVGPTSGKTLTYRDVDGDLVTVKTNKGTLDAAQFTFAPGLLGSQLLEFRTGSSTFAGADISFIATPSGGKGDGFVNVGHLDSTGVNLGKVVVDGDLGRITAEFGSQGIAVASLTAHSMGRFGTSTQLPGSDLASELAGRLGALTIKTDLVNAEISTTGAMGSMGNVFIAGSILGGGAQSGLFSSLAMGNVTLGGSLVGGSVTDSGKIFATDAIGKVTLGGSILGGTGINTALIQANGNMGAVSVKGEILGGTMASSGTIYADGDITSVALGGSIVGGGSTAAAANAGSIYTAGGPNSDIGPAKIGGNLLGGTGQFSGILNASGKLGAVTLLGSLIGRDGYANASIFGGSLSTVNIGRDVRAGAGLYSGSIYSVVGDVGAISIGGSLTGLDSADSGIYSARNLGVVKIGGSVRGDVPGGVRIQAEGLLNPPTAAKAVTIAGLSVKGSVRSALILAGYDDNAIDDAVNPDAGIGAVSIGGNFLATSLIAGATRGADNLFGTADDAKAPGEAAPDAIFAKIAAITIKGIAAGTPGVSDDHFGIVAEQIGKLIIGAYKAPLTPGADTAGFPTGTTGDLRVREI